MKIIKHSVGKFISYWKLIFIRIFSCPVGQYCHNKKRVQWNPWITILIICFILFIIGYILLRHNIKLIRLKYLFSHHRLHEQIGLEVNTVYSHLPTNEMNSHDQSLEDVLYDENPVSTIEMNNDQTEEFLDDPFYVDEKQPIFSNTKSNISSIHTGIL